jgi:hypothetical protein
VAGPYITQPHRVATAGGQGLPVGGKLGEHLPGKAVWFGFPSAVGWEPRLGTASPEISAARELRSFLAERGVTGVGVTQALGHAVVAIPGGLNFTG